MMDDNMLHELAERSREIARLRADVELKTEALQSILQWADAYPLDIFHEPSKDECKRASDLLVANGMTLDAFSASMGRHCLKGVGDIARAALAPDAKDMGKIRENRSPAVLSSDQSG